MNQKLLYRIVFIIFLVSFGASVFFFYKANFPDTPVVVTPPPPPNPYGFVPETRSLDQNNRIGLGVYDLNQEKTNLASVVGFEDLIDRKLEYNLFFKAWGDEDKDFPVKIVPYLKQYKLTAVITWEPWKRDFVNASAFQPEYSLQSIIDGKHDDYIKSWADAARDAGIPIIIRFAQEAATTPGIKSWYPWQGEPENYKLAFQKIVYMFRSSGAQNVKFMWNPYPGFGNAKDYYPGNDFVDYIGMTVINFGDGLNNSGAPLKWQPCNDILDGQYNIIKNYPKPIIIAEFLSSDKGGAKAVWYNECFPELNKLKNIVGLILIQVDETQTISEINADWRVNSNPSSLLNFRLGIRNGDFK